MNKVYFIATMVLAYLLPQTPWVWAQAGDINFDRQLLITINNQTTSGLGGAGSTWKGWNYGGGYRTSAPINYRVTALTKDHDLTLVNEWPIRVIGVHCIVVSVPEHVNLDSTIDLLDEHPFVDSVQRMRLFATQTLHYNDPLLELQKNVSEMHVLPVHQWSQGKGVKIGVIDTGININHPDLRGQITKMKDFVKQADDAFDDDEHGTAIAGIIAAIADNSEGIVGVAPLTQLQSYKACWQRQDSSGGAVCSSFTLAQALATAIDDDVDILNLSLAGPHDPLLARIVRAGIDQGITVVGAVGNSIDINQQFPAAVPGVIAVKEKTAEVTQAVPDQIKVFIAPGADILTTTAAGKYNYQSGSSLSAAHVTGVVALLKSVRPRLMPNQIVALLNVNNELVVVDNKKFGDWTNRVAEVNACQALNSLMQSNVCE